MRFDQAVWESMSVIERMGYTMSCILDRAQRFCAALDSAGVPYAVCGGMSVMAWISSRNPDFVRTTKDVDVLMRREDLPRASMALATAGFTLVDVRGVTMFLDGPDGTPKTAVHVVLADEPPSFTRLFQRPASSRCIGTTLRRGHGSRWPRCSK